MPAAAAAAAAAPAEVTAPAAKSLQASVTFKRGSSLPPGGIAARTAASERAAGASGVSWQQLSLFVFPSNLEHPESTGRLELFARYGPVDENGRLRGGVGGHHTHTDLEIRQMIAHETREMLFNLIGRPRATVEVIVDALMPLALTQNYTAAEVRKLLRNVQPDSNKRFSFSELQWVILNNQKQRLQALLKNGVAKQERAPQAHFQSKAAALLMSPSKKKKQNRQEEQLTQLKRLHSFSAMVAGLEDQNLTSQICANVTLCRGPGDVGDRWDRYCALRRVGKASYVQARNESHAGIGCMDDGGADKHAGCSSLVAAMMHR